MAQGLHKKKKSMGDLKVDLRLKMNNKTKLRSN